MDYRTACRHESKMLICRCQIKRADGAVVKFVCIVTKLLRQVDLLVFYDTDMVMAVRNDRLEFRFDRTDEVGFFRGYLQRRESVEITVYTQSVGRPKK